VGEGGAQKPEDRQQGEVASRKSRRLEQGGGEEKKSRPGVLVERDDGAGVPE